LEKLNQNHFLACTLLHLRKYSHRDIEASSANSLPVAEAGGGFLKVKSKPPTGTVTPPKAYAVGGANAGNSTGLPQKIILGGFLVLESPLTLVAITPPKANAAR
jgi:hypothetical protein